MAKQKQAETEVEPVEQSAPVEVRKSWLVRPISGARPEQVVHADTLEDAIRAYNGDRSSYTRKQLEIVEG